MVVITGAGLLLYITLIFLLLRRRRGRDNAEIWLLVHDAFSIMLLLAFLGVERGLLEPVRRADFMLVLAVSSTILIGFVSLYYIRRPYIMPWAIFGGVWLLATIGTMVSGQPTTVMPGQMVEGLLLQHEIAILGWGIAVLVLIVLSLQSFLTEPLPLYANRILFWLVVLPFIAVGDMLLFVDTPVTEVGVILRMIGAVGATYALLTDRVIDLRETARWLVSRFAFTLMIGLLVFTGFMVALYLQPTGLSPLEHTLIAAGIALLVGLLTQPALSLIRWLLRNLVSREISDVTAVVRQYIQRISGVIDLRELATIATRSVTSLLSARRGYLILATYLEDRVVLETVGVERAPGGQSAIFATDSPILTHFVSESGALHQFDVEYQRSFSGVSPDERAFLTSLEMDIYAPIVNEGRLLGFFALGPKYNDDPFTSRETELLEALANQTVAALENARLVSDLRTLNERISNLNETLQTSNERLEQLDKVKTDFIAIASHELRTPLTQVQGYADLLLEMSKRNMLDPTQTEDITRSLSSASQRMAEVISSMLDVSQIDVENMDLNFVETNLANIVKLAIDGYSDAIEARNLTLTARGLRDLPPINADYKRLVQAFQNVVSNAIKYTPDNGSINVTGGIYERDPQGNPLSVRISVTDTGIGIDPSSHELIFEKFYRVGSPMLHSTGSTKFKGAGPGLGLPITRGIIEGHGGQIWVESVGYDEENLNGSTFHIVLPLIPPSIDAQQRLAQMQAAKEQTIIAPNYLEEE